ncbi:transfer complex protein, partial [Enterococcus hirae]
ASTTIEESGVLYGYHATTDAPVYLDRFCRENGYNVLVAGEIGSVKSYDTKRLLLRRVAKDRDTAIVMIDPVGGFSSLAAGLDAEH